jgi:transcriptional/translational regulatory protein YebC/TACO1
VEKTQAKEDELMTIALEAGAEDFSAEEKNYEITTAPQDFDKVKQALEAKGIKYLDGEVTMLPSSTVKVSGGEAKQVLALIEALEEHDDVQQVYANFDIPDEILDQVSAQSE